MRFSLRLHNLVLAYGRWDQFIAADYLGRVSI